MFFTRTNIKFQSASAKCSIFSFQTPYLQFQTTPHVNIHPNTHGSHISIRASHIFRYPATISPHINLCGGACMQNLPFGTEFHHRAHFPPLSNACIIKCSRAKYLSLSSSATTEMQKSERENRVVAAPAHVALHSEGEREEKKMILRRRCCARATKFIASQIDAATAEARTKIKGKRVRGKKASFFCFRRCLLHTRVTHLFDGCQSFGPFFAHASILIANALTVPKLRAKSFPRASLAHSWKCNCVTF